jgi:apolipoprotein N-acyltransferase
MRLIDNWKTVLLRSWTAWAGYVLASLNGISIAVYLYTSSLPVAPIWLIVLNGAFGVALPLLRIKQQPSISGDDQ